MSLVTDKKRTAHFFSIGVFLSAALLWYLANTIPFFAINPKKAESNPPLAQLTQQRLLRFVYEISNPGAQSVQDAVFSSYLPIKKTANQRVTYLKTSQPFREETGLSGNRVGHFDLGFVAPFGKKRVSIVVQMDMAGSGRPINLEDRKKYLIEEAFIETHHPKIKQLANKLKAASASASVNNIYRWVSRHIHYAGYIPQDRGALYAVQNRQGDCTEYMYVVIALARSLGIPARGVGGYVYQTNRLVSPADYHNWAEVYLDGAWRIVDAQKKTFMQNSENYIAMRLLSDPSVSLLGSSHRFSITNNTLKIAMR